MDKRKEFRHDRHTVSLLTDHMMFSPKYRGKILIRDIAMFAEAIIYKTCKDIETIETAVNPDHVHIFLQISTEIFFKLYCKENKRKNKQNPEKRIPPPQRMVWRPPLGTKLLPWLSRERMGGS